MIKWDRDSTLDVRVRIATSARDECEKAIELNDLRVFHRVASVASFSRAAAILGIHKSSVSRSVVRLESTLRAELLDRSSARKIRLTRCGAALHEHCAELLSRIDEMIQHVSRIDAGWRTGRLPGSSSNPSNVSGGAARIADPSNPIDLSNGLVASYVGYSGILAIHDLPSIE